MSEHRAIEALAHQYLNAFKSGSGGNSIAMLVFRRESDGAWRVCAEAEVS